MDVIKINSLDNVAVLLNEKFKGDKVYADGCETEVIDDIPAGHKIALIDIDEGKEVVKYGNRIGFAKTFIKAGSHVHTHNIVTALTEKCEYEYTPVEFEKFEKKNATFKGYLRRNGKAGIRNEIWIIPTVGCVNDIARAIEREALKYIEGNVENIIAFRHPYGCSQMSEDQENTRNILADLINHPNAGGVLVLGLGCENSNIGVLKEYIGNVDDKRVKYLVAQEYNDEISKGVELIKEIINEIKDDKRSDISADKLIVGLKCGGSDGFSGITANPTVGAFSDILIKAGGSTILTEVPEMFGAESLLFNRCASKDVFNDAVDLINDFKEYFISNNQTIYENPSPGNKAGGISTLEDKSLGCTQKSGSMPISDVLKYGDRVTKTGLNLLSAPGNDLVASTALAAAGAQLVLFTTGRGTPFASPVPTLKISSNNRLYESKYNWIDFNAGTVVDGDSIADKSNELFDKVLCVCSGEKVCSENLGYHDMAIFKKGVTL